MIEKLLIANRAEIAIRIQRAATDSGIDSVSIASEDDTQSLHARGAERLRILSGRGPRAYLDGEAIIAIARDEDCDAIHPGYGFLSENSDFVRACEAAGLRFVGPTSEQIARLGDKTGARALARECGIPVPEGLDSSSLGDIRAFMRELGEPIMIKALAGGGGRGIRLVRSSDELEQAFERCCSEAERAFGDPRVYAERAITQARHIEVQIAGDGEGNVVHLGERDCSLQRRHQKMLEIAPAPQLSRQAAGRMHDMAVRLGEQVNYENLGTIEFLVDARDHQRMYFLEANPRLQVEHTVTEELWGVDLVRAQLVIAGGGDLEQAGLIGLSPSPGHHLQARIGMERLGPDGAPMTDAGRLSEYELPGGPGIRIDGFGYRNYVNNPAFDPLLAKLVVSTRGSLVEALAKMRRALSELKIEGVSTNIDLLRALAGHEALADWSVTTEFFDAQREHLLEEARRLSAARPRAKIGDDYGEIVTGEPELPEGVQAVRSGMTGSLVSVAVEVGREVVAGQAIAVVEAMKMEYLIPASATGVVVAVFAQEGESVREGQVLAALRITGDTAEQTGYNEKFDPDRIRPDLAEALAARQRTFDEGRPGAAAVRHEAGSRTARENIAALCDVDSFVEYGGLAVAAQRARRSLKELLERTPADGCVVGFGNVNGESFAPESSQSLVIAFDPTVLAGTMGEMAREKIKRALAVATEACRPVVLFAEGGGGRAGDTDGRLSVTGWTMDVSTYHQFSRMSGLVPLVGVAHGRTFAANAGMLSCCDVIIATSDSNIGVGGPSMIEGGRLGQFAPEDIGPAAEQVASGVIDILVNDEREATQIARKYLSFFQGSLLEWEAPDQRILRAAVPENRLRAYDMRHIIETLCDADSVLELRRGFGQDIITVLVRIEGRSVGIVANNPMHMGGAIQSNGADKACRFMQLCEAFSVPILFLCDTPGMMVGPEAERTATVRKMGRMFVTGGNLSVPFFTIVTRKGYGIGAELMAGGWFKAPRFLIAWPTAEFGGMNIEGNVKLAHRAELAEIADDAERQKRFEELVAAMHVVGKATAVATHFEIDAVIDPAESRRWIASVIKTHRPRLPGDAKTIPFVSPW